MITNLDSLSYLSNVETRSISAENPTGEKGAGAMTELEDGIAKKAAQDLGKGWKVNPYMVLQPGEVKVLADVKGSGAIKHIWMTPTGFWRQQIIRFYWDDSDIPAIECPLGDFFAMGWEKYAQLNSLAVCVNPGRAFNCYWTMPFRKSFKITLENLNVKPVTIFHQITYELKEQPDNIAYFHAHFRRQNPLPYKEVFTILDNVEGQGHFVGTYMAWGLNHRGWWGEGEIKFYMDGDQEYPTICGTGTEDYFCGSFGFFDPVTNDRYLEFSTPYAGLHQVITPDKFVDSQFRFGMYRWHITDPIHFQSDLKVTIQSLGWTHDGSDRYLLRQDDIAAVAYFYLDKPYTNLPKLPDRDFLIIN